MTIPWRISGCNGQFRTIIWENTRAQEPGSRNIGRKKIQSFERDRYASLSLSNVALIQSKVPLTY